MTRENLDVASNLGLQQKVSNFIKWLSHLRRTPQELAVYSSLSYTLKRVGSESAEMRAYAAEGLGGVDHVHARRAAYQMR